MDDVCTLADVGTGVAYMLTAVAFFTWKRSLVALLAVASCSTLLYFLAQNLIAGGLSVLAPAMLMMTLGVGFFTVLKRIQ
jgi:hypothetical protein